MSTNSMFIEERRFLPQSLSSVIPMTIIINVFFVMIMFMINIINVLPIVIMIMIIMIMIITMIIIIIITMIKWTWDADPGWRITEL